MESLTSSWNASQGPAAEPAGGWSVPSTTSSGCTRNCFPAVACTWLHLVTNCTSGSADQHSPTDAIAATVTEVVLDAARPASLQYDVQLLDRSEVAEAMTKLAKSANVLHGVWPRAERLRLTPPDEDGEVRPQPV